jgi:hypothetical protein
MPLPNATVAVTSVEILCPDMRVPSDLRDRLGQYLVRLRYGKQGRKDVFFEKKKQKTFDPCAPRQSKRARPRAKVFWFFFSKKNILPCFLRTQTWPST